MRVNWGFIKALFLLGLVIFLFAFSSSRNMAREASSPIIKFIGDDNLFITQETVSKLLIQKQQGVKKASKEILDLNELETALNSNPMIRTAEVTLDIKGKLSAVVEQKKPIARVSTNASYYIDSEGGFMPLSNNYSARVPLVTGDVEKNKLSNIFKVAEKVFNDKFLKTNVVQINHNVDNTFDLSFRQCNFTVHLGSVKQLEKKINNFKAFYQKALKEKTLDNYSKVNLQFDNQVVCTKK